MMKSVGVCAEESEVRPTMQRCSHPSHLQRHVLMYAELLTDCRGCTHWSRATCWRAATARPVPQRAMPATHQVLPFAFLERAHVCFQCWWSLHVSLRIAGGCLIKLRLGGYAGYVIRHAMWEDGASCLIGPARNKGSAARRRVGCALKLRSSLSCSTSTANKSQCAEALTRRAQRSQKWSLRLDRSGTPLLPQY